MNSTSKCVICGAEFPSAVVWSAPTRENGYTPKPFPKELCDACAAQTTKCSGKVYHYNPGIRPYVELAGAIESRVLSEYRIAYEKALDAADELHFDVLLTEDEAVFLGLHRRLTEAEGTYHQALTMSNLPDLLDAARRSVEQSDKRFEEMRKSGYDVFQRGEQYRAWKKQHEKEST